MTKKFAFEEAKTYEPVQRESQNLYDLIKRKKIDDYWEIIEIIYGIKKLSPTKRKFSGFISRWQMPFPCKALTVFKIS